MNITQRKHGRMVFKTESNQEKLEAFDWIVNNKDFAIVNGIAVDMNSASIIVQMCEQITEKARKKFLSYKVPVMIKLAWKVLGNMAV